MGNYASCALAAAAHPPSAAAAQVILPTAEVRHAPRGSTAADLMLDFPGHFLAHARSLRVGSRFIPLVADEDLEPGAVYAMFPMRRVNSPVNAADMGPLILAAGKAVRRASRGRARVLPEASPPPAAVAEPRLKVEDDEEEEVTEFRNRLSVCRSRRPRLETIAEESCAC